jgi:hypothetical protein
MRVYAQQFCRQFWALGEVENARAALRVAEIPAGTLPQGARLCNKYSSIPKNARDYNFAFIEKEFRLAAIVGSPTEAKQNGKHCGPALIKALRQCHEDPSL